MKPYEIDDDLYPTCPRCRGSRFVYAITEPSNGFTPSRGEEFFCPLCQGVGSTARETVEAYLAERRENESLT